MGFFEWESKRVIIISVNCLNELENFIELDLALERGVSGFEENILKGGVFNARWKNQKGHCPSAPFITI